MAAYQRILLKLSGESLAGTSSHGIDPVPLEQFADEVARLHHLGIETGVVIGGGNIFRGVTGMAGGFDRVKGDYMGMLATAINGLALQSALHTRGIPARLFTSIRMEPAAEFWNRDLVVKSLINKEICIFSGGTGNPFFTTDTTAALRAVETSAEVLLKGTRIDGVYTSDPEKNPSATRYDQLTFDEAIDKNLKIMDQTAFTLCRENNLPIIVFDMNTPGNLLRLVQGEKIGTIIRK